MTSYNGQSITYDTIGNPLSYRDGMSFTWQGRKLQTATVGTNSLAFAYNADGIRTQKTVNGTTTYYTLDGSKVIAQHTGDTVLYFEYDAAGNVATVTSGTNTYYYIRNVMGDILGLADESGNRVVTYTYDPWGKILETTDTSGTNIGTINPFRYKGYYYDTETGLYYLNSRYYDPETGRWISPEPNVFSGGYDTGAGLTGYNVYAYCANNPVIYKDETGESITLTCILIGAGIGALYGGVSNIAGQAISGQKINWAEVGISTLSGAVIGTITTICPTMGAVATGVVHGLVGAGTYAATELVNGRTPTFKEILLVGGMNGLLAGGTKAISNKLIPTTPKNAGVPFRGVGKSQVGVDPNTLKLNSSFTPNPNKYNAALNQINTNGMYGVVEVYRNGLVINGQHRVLIARQLGISIDVVIR